MKIEEINNHDIFNEISHYNRKGILSDYYYGYLKAHKDNMIEDRIGIVIKSNILEDMLLNSLKRGISFDPFNELTIFYNQNSRGDFHEIKRYKKLFPEILKLIPLIDQGLKRLLENKYELIRTKLEKKGNWSLYHVLIDKEFQLYIQDLTKEIELSN